MDKLKLYSKRFKLHYHYYLFY